MKVITKGSILLCVFACIFSLAACNNKKEDAKSVSTQESAQEEPGKAAKADPYGRFEDEVTITIGKSISESSTLPKEDSFEDNEYVRYMSEQLNVEYVHAWQASGDAYDQRVSLALASGDIPDVMVVSSSQLKQMYNSDLLEDMTDVFEANVSDNLREAYDSTDGKAIESATIDGKLMALPSISPGADGINLLWIRQDWLNNLGLSEPESLDDIIKIATAFRDQDPDGNGADDTYGLLGTSDIVNIGNNLYGFDSIFAYYDSYPELWITDDDGSIVYGSIRPQTKTALAKLNELYTGGLIDHEFAIKDTNKSNELTVNSRAGVFFGPWWIPFWPLNDSVSLNAKAEWKAYLAPLTEDGTYNTHMISPSSSFLVVKKGFENPAAVVRTCNMQYDMDQVQGEGFYEGQNVSFNWVAMPFTLLLSNYTEKELKALKVQNVIDGKAEAGTLFGEMQQIYESYLVDKENPKKDINAWAQANAFLTGALPLNDERINKVYGAYYDVTPTMEKKWANLEKLEDETFLKIILGTEDIDEFDNFVKQWRALGGDEITAEIEEILRK